MQTGFKIEIFSQKNCAACEQVKQLFNRRGLVYQELLIDSVLGSNRQELFKRLPTVRSVPQVFINNKHIGGLEQVIVELSTNDYY